MKVWEISSIIFIFFIGSLLHFTFKLSGYWKPLAVISAVNESVWEHLKLGFWPAFFFAFIEGIFLFRQHPNFLLAKALQLYIIPLAIIILFYSYNTVLGHHMLFFDISIFFVAICIAQYVSYRALLIDRALPTANTISLLCIIFAGLAFGLLSYYPPKIFLFRDSRNGLYGIIK